MSKTNESEKSMRDLSALMRRIDFCMLTTRTEGGRLASRPMSDNGDVEYDGDSWFFAYETARSISDIEADPNVTLGFQGAPGLLGAPPLFVSVQGRADVVRDRAAFAAHWRDDLERWFPQGVETPGMVMIHVRAERVSWWERENEGEILV